MPKVVSQFKVPVVIMHIKGTPKNMQANPVYEALIPEIVDYLRESTRGLALNQELLKDKIIIDPDRFWEDL